MIKVIYDISPATANNLFAFQEYCYQLIINEILECLFRDNQSFIVIQNSIYSLSKHSIQLTILYTYQNTQIQYIAVNLCLLGLTKIW